MIRPFHNPSALNLFGHIQARLPIHLVQLFGGLYQQDRKKKIKKIQIQSLEGCENSHWAQQSVTNGTLDVDVTQKYLGSRKHCT